MPSAIFSTAQAVELGKFVLQAYKQYLTPASFALPAGYSLVSTIYADDITDGLPDYLVFGFIAQSGGDVVVAIRGTENFMEWVQDFKFSLIDFPDFDAGQTEHGFTGLYSTLRIGPANTADRVFDAIKQLVDGGSLATLRITGHSMGAAVATMLALEVVGKGVFKAPVVYTFASPRVGDKVFAGTYDSLVETSWRIANLNDLVTQLPPQWVGYAHVDADLPINSDDRCKHTLACWHALDTYLNTLDASVLLDSTCVP